MNNKSIIGVIGAGAWGTVLANLLAKKGNPVDLWVYEQDLCADISNKRENTLYFKDFKLSSNIRPSNSLKEVVFDKKYIVMVVPSHAYRQVVIDMKEYLHKDVIIISATKGIENIKLLTMHGIFKDVFGKEIPSYSILAGPSFAKEVALEMPTAVTVAACDNKTAKDVQELFSTPYFRVYTSLDIIGLEVGSATKNVIAIASGICDGMGFGSNTRAAVISRGIHEVVGLGVKLGADPVTFAGVGVLGDFILTCTGDLSRNHQVGIKLGKGMKIEKILGEMNMVAEGIKTTKSVYDLARKIGVEMPIVNEVYEILYNGKDPVLSMKSLMARKLKDEFVID